MKQIIIVIMIAFTNQINAQITKAEIIATGLTCSMCSNAINKQLKTIAEADSIQIDLNANKFTVFFKNEVEITPEILKSKVEKAGFFVGDMIIHFNSTKITKNQYVILEGSLNGNKNNKARVIDKGYTTNKEYKKLSKKYKDSTLVNDNEEDFHLIVL